MVDIETLIILTSNAVIAGVACITFGIASKKQKDLRTYLISYIFFAIECVLSTIQFGNFTILLIAMIFLVLSAISFFIAIFLEYYNIFIKSPDQNLTIRDKLTAVIIVSLVIIGIEIFIIIIVSIGAIMLFRIYLKTHFATKLFQLINAISAVICAIALYISNFGIEGAYFLSNVIVTFFVTLILSTSFVSILEQKIVVTLNEKNTLKDKYSHDLGNILHTISMTYELFNIEHSSEIKSDELDNLIKVKIKEASELVKFIRRI
jgi:hypothetical protein